MNCRFILFFVSVVVAAEAKRSSAEIEVLGIPVKSTMVSATAVGQNEKGEGVFYFSCSQPGNHLFLLEANPRTGASRQWSSPVGEGAWAIGGCSGPSSVSWHVGKWLPAALRPATSGEGNRIAGETERIGNVHLAACGW